MVSILTPASGAVIVGSVDGNRIWGKELKPKLSYVRWSPDAKLILFGTESGDLELYDETGVFVVRVFRFSHQCSF